MKPAILSLWLLVAGVCYAAPFVDEPVAELRLKSGKVYRQAIAKSFSATSILVRHADGATSVKYDELPDELAAAADAKKPEAKPLIDPRKQPAVVLHNGPTTTVSGQIFIATKGSENVKLGNVRVSILSRDDYQKQRAWQKSQLNPTADAAKQKALRAVGNDTVYAHAQADLYQDIIFGNWQRIHVSEFTTVTDAEGRFSISHRIEGPYVVFASAKRHVGTEREFYFWAIESEKISEPANLLLQNENKL